MCPPPRLALWVQVGKKNPKKKKHRKLAKSVSVADIVTAQEQRNAECEESIEQLEKCVDKLRIMRRMLSEVQILGLVKKNRRSTADDDDDDDNGGGMSAITPVD